MSYVGTPFEHDVFVTYSHGDTQGDGTSLLKRWSQAFARELESELRTLPNIGNKLSLFLDQHHRSDQSVDPMMPLTEQLKKDIGASGVVTVLMSPHYLASAWCRDERDWWHDGQVALRIPHEGRIAIARIWPVGDDATWPELFVDSRGHPLVGYPFYDPSKAPAACRPFEWPAPTQDSATPFRDHLVDLVSGIYQALNELKQRLELRQKAAGEVARLAGEEQVVYLHGRADQARAWEETNDTLSSNGFTVLPTEPDPADQTLEHAQETRHRRVEMLSACDALLLLGSADGRSVDSDLIAIGRHERQLARAHSNRFLPCALLDTVGESLATDRRRLAARKLQVDWIDRRVDPWVPKVRDWLSRKSQDLEAAL